MWTPSNPASLARRAACPKAATTSSMSSGVASRGCSPYISLAVGDGAIGPTSGIIVWLPAWPISAKIRPPLAWTASVTWTIDPTRRSSYSPGWLALAWPRGST